MPLLRTQFTLPGQTGFYRGKVRDVYTIKYMVPPAARQKEMLEDVLIMVATDRISAFDHILPQPIPYKGQVLNQIAGLFLEESKDIVPNWVLAIPDPNVTAGIRCEPFAVEMVIRAYLAGHAWRTYKTGKRELCGVKLPEGLVENDPLPEPIITPTTKARAGHDEDITREELILKEIVSKNEYEQLETYTRRLFEFGQRKAADRGLILVDTKYEFGKKEGKIYLIDEIHTPDSSRYFYAGTYADLLRARQPQRQLSKEFVREWLIECGFQGLEGQQIPEMTAAKVDEISSRYIELFEILTGNAFYKRVETNLAGAIEQNIFAFLGKNA